MTDYATALWQAHFLYTVTHTHTHKSVPVSWSVQILYSLFRRHVFVVLCKQLNPAGLHSGGASCVTVGFSTGQTYFHCHSKFQFYTETPKPILLFIMIESTTYTVQYVCQWTRRIISYLKGNCRVLLNRQKSASWLSKPDLDNTGAVCRNVSWLKQRRFVKTSEDELMNC